MKFSKTRICRSNDFIIPEGGSRFNAGQNAGFPVAKERLPAPRPGREPVGARRPAGGAGEVATTIESDKISRWRSK